MTSIVAYFIGGFFCGWLVRGLYRFVYRRGAVAGALGARTQIELENEAEDDDGRLAFTAYPTFETVMIGRELIRAVIPFENDATAIVLSNGMSLAVAETIENVERALK